MADEERTAVEETKAAEEEKAAEEAEVEEKAEVEESKAVEETKIEAKTDEKAKAGDAPEETKTSDGGSGDSEVSYEVQKAIETIPPELPPGAILTFNVHHIGNDPEYYASGCVGLFNGAVLLFNMISGGVHYGNIVLYPAFIASLIDQDSVLAPRILELSECGSSMPSKDSTRFTMNMVCIGGGK